MPMLPARDRQREGNVRQKAGRVLLEVWRLEELRSAPAGDDTVLAPDILALGSTALAGSPRDADHRKGWPPMRWPEAGCLISGSGRPREALSRELLLLPATFIGRVSSAPSDICYEPVPGAWQPAYRGTLEPSPVRPYPPASTQHPTFSGDHSATP